VWDPLYFYESIHSPLKWVRDYPVHHVNGEQFGTSPNHIRAAVNGAFYSWLLGDLNPLPTPDGDIGDGTTGDWMHGNNCESRRWAFGMDATGCAFGSGRMRWAGFYSNEGHEIFMVPDYIEQSFAYGFSNVGLLVDNGGMLSSTQSVWGANADNAMPRTAVAWSSLESGRRHFFLVASTSARWVDMAAFFAAPIPPDDPTVGILQKYMAGPPFRTRPFVIEKAIMLDGGSGSTQFAYMFRGKSSPVLQDSGAPDGDFRPIPSFLGVGIYCKP